MVLICIKFLGEWLSQVGKQFYSTATFDVQEFPSGSEMIRSINDQNVYLVPYDCGKDFSPIYKNGETSHWATIVGYFIVTNDPISNDEACDSNIKFERIKDGNIKDNELYLVAYQGKSK